MDHQNKEFKQLQTLLTDLEEQLENINKKVKFNNHRLNELEHENDLLKENIKTLEVWTIIEFFIISFPKLSTFFLYI